MSLPSLYEDPEDPEEEADIWGVPGPEWLTPMPDSSTADREAELLEASNYDESQEQIDEAELAQPGSIDWIADWWSSLSDAEREAVRQMIQQMPDEE